MKRIIVACDGTWVDSDNGFVRDSWLPWKTGGKLVTPTNVTRICRALKPRSDDGVPQIVYYQAGVGSANNVYSYYLGGYLGQGIGENIREAYAFVCNNYEDGDEIFILGFSRGAFTARSMGAMISEVGLLTGRGLDSFYPIFKDWENQAIPEYKPEYGTHDWPVDRPLFNNPKWIQTLVQQHMTRPSIPTKAIAVWDTVGTLGIPELDIAGFKVFSHERKELSFVNTEVPCNVEFAYHALALDEDRKTFAPTVWEYPNPRSPHRLKELKQVWFPGVHSNIGGGYPDTSIADITLAWIVTQLQRLLTFDEIYVLHQQKLNEQYYPDHNEPVASWAMGQIMKSDAGILNSITGRAVRTPGEYHAMDSLTAKPLPRRLTNTCEFIHPSVRYRIQQRGPGLATKDSEVGHGTYAPTALHGWEFAPAGQKLGEGFEVENGGLGRWERSGKWFVRRADGSCTVIVEESLTGLEVALVEAWPGVAEKVQS